MKKRTFNSWLIAGVLSVTVCTACGPGGDSKRTGDEYDHKHVRDSKSDRNESNQMDSDTSDHPE